MERRRYRSCGSKVRYDNEHAALRAMRTAMIERGHATRYYGCEHCGGFHLTSKGV